MASSEERQISIFLRKHNLDEIEKELCDPLLAELPHQEEDQQQTLRAALKEARAVDAEIKQLKLINGYLTTQRTQQQLKINEIMNMLGKANEEYSELNKSIEQCKIHMELNTSEYHNKLQRVTNRSRELSHIYDEEITRAKTEEDNKVLAELLAEERALRHVFEEKKKILDTMKPDVPDNILEIIGKRELEEMLNST